MNPQIQPQFPLYSYFELPAQTPKTTLDKMGTEMSGAAPALPSRTGPKFVALFVLSCLIGIAVLFSKQSPSKSCNEVFSEVSDRFVCHWSRDLIKLQSQNPEFWRNVRHFKLIPANRESQDWSKKIASKIKIPQNPNGEFQIEAILIYWRDGDTIGTTLQYSVVEFKSKNTVFETGATYRLGKVKRRPKNKKPD